MMTDGEAYLVEQPVPLGPRGYDDRKAAGPCGLGPTSATDH